MTLYKILVSQYDTTQSVSATLALARGTLETGALLMVSSLLKTSTKPTRNASDQRPWEFLVTVATLGDG